MPASRMIERLRREEGGFTLIELMVGISVGLIVLFAAFNLIDSTSKATQKVDDRVDTTQRGRLAMGHITQSLRSRVCLEANDPTNNYADDSTTSVIYADSNIVLFYADLGDENFRPDLILFWYVAGGLHEFTFTASGTAPNLTYDLNDWSKYRSIATHVSPPPSGQVFRYYAGRLTPTAGDPDNYATDLQLSPGGGALSASDLKRVLRIDIAFKVSPVKGETGTPRDTTFQSTVTARGARPPTPAKDTNGDGQTDVPADPGGVECLFS
jgi:prepilin-type N-terminal cleavage/methylation domain-containing protein